MSPIQQSDLSVIQSLHGEAGSVDKIRDILFGAQMRDYEARFARLEEQLMKETAEIRETSRRRSEQLESYILREFKAVRDERAAADNLRQRGQGQDDEIRARSKELAAIFESHIRDLRDGKIDRAALAELLTEVALRLSDEFRTPSAMA